MDLEVAGMHRGDWFLWSDVDPRWFANGICTEGPQTAERACRQALERLKETLGDPPEDVTWVYKRP